MAPTADSTAPQGLSSAQAAELLATHGPNALPGAGSRRWTAIARETLTEPMFLLLLGAAVLYGLLGDWQEGGILLGLVVMVVAIMVARLGLGILVIGLQIDHQHPQQPLQRLRPAPGGWRR